MKQLLKVLVFSIGAIFGNCSGIKIYNQSSLGFDKVYWSFGGNEFFIGSLAKSSSMQVVSGVAVSRVSVASDVSSKPIPIDQSNPTFSLRLLSGQNKEFIFPSNKVILFQELPKDFAIVILDAPMTGDIKSDGLFFAITGASCASSTLIIVTPTTQHMK